MLAKVTRGNQLTIPKEIVVKAHLRDSACEYVDVQYMDGVIFLKPVIVEERISSEQYDKFASWALKESEGEYKTRSPEESVHFLKKRIKKK